MNILILIIFFASSFYYPRVDSAKILGVFPTASISHQIVFRALYSELVKRGHELVVVTPDPIYRNKTAPENLTEIDIGYFYEFHNRSHPIWQIYIDKINIQRGVIIKPKDSLHIVDLKFYYKIILGMYAEVFEIIKDKNFDLILFEPSALYTSLVFCDIFKAPAVMITSHHGSPGQFATVGAVSRHPILHPNYYRNKYDNLNIFEKIYEVYLEYKFYKSEKTLEKEEDKYIREQFGSVPPMRELKKYVQLFLVNCHQLFDNNRPVPPGVVYLGRMHLQPKKELPVDLKSYLDSSKRGVIYVSLGTNVRIQYMDSELINEFLDAFENLPYDILWKSDSDDLDRIPKNVKIQKWLPQRDLLGHPNIKLFITQGGLQSTDEAIDAGVPLVGIPCVGDQWYNVQKYVEFGIGVQLDSLTLTARDIIQAANTVLSDESYRINIRELNNIIKDQKETPIERAVWWTEYVLRHKKPRHLLSPAAGMSWSEYLMVDVIIVLAIIFFIASLIILTFLYYSVRLLLFVNKNLKIKKDQCVIADVKCK